jgi:hypothetical protein
MPGSKTKVFGMQKLLTQKDVAKQLGIAPQIVAASTKSGILNHVLLPGHRKPRYTQKHIEEFLIRSEPCPNENDFLKT